MYLEKLNLSFIQPCTTDSLRIRINSIPSRNISEIFPYLNTYCKSGIYNKKANTFTLNYGPKIIIMYEESINVSKLLNETDAFETLDYIKDLINKVYENKDEIKPSDEMRKLPSPIEIYKYLPKINCGKCNEVTCLSFANKLINNKTKPRNCVHLYEKGNEENKDKIESIYIMLGNDL